MGNLQAAKTSFEKALTEHRTPDYRLNLSEVEAAIKKQEEEAYINPELAEAEKLKGNDWYGILLFFFIAIIENC